MPRRDRAVDGERSVRAVQPQGILIVDTISDCGIHRVFRRVFRQMFTTPREDAIQYRNGFLLPQGEPLFRRPLFRTIFHFVQFGDHFDHLRRRRSFSSCAQ